MSGDELVEGIDYYRENGYMVFTAIYLKKRGFCCRSGCRHCPYGFVREDEPPQAGLNCQGFVSGHDFSRAES